MSQSTHEPRKPHWDAAIQILKNIKGALSKGLLFPPTNNLVLKAFCDLDWESCHATRRLIIGYCFFLENLPSHGKPRNKPTYLNLQHKPNIELWLTHVWS